MTTTTMLAQSIPGKARKAPIDHMSPMRVASIGIVVYLVMYILSPVDIVTPQSLAPYLYIGLGYISFFLGCVIAGDPRGYSPRIDNTSHGLSDKQLISLHRTVTIAAAIGAMLKLIDLFLVRGVSLAGSFLDRRNELDTVGANPVSIVCAIVLPACLLVPFTYKLIEQRGLGSRQLWILAHLLFLVPVLGGVLISGGRSVILIYLVMYLLYSFFLGKLKITPKAIFWLLVCGILSIAVTTAIFNNRLAAMNMSSLDSVYTSGFALTVQPQTWIGQIIMRHNGLVGDTAFSYLLISQYYVHGVFEFVNQYRQAPPIHLYGVASFNAFYKFVAFVMSWPGPEQLYDSVTVHPGVYTTFFGPIYSDFGWLGMIYMTFLGVISQRLWRQCRANNIAAVPFYLYLVLIIYCFPILNYIVLSLGLYNLSVFAIFFWVTPRRSELGRPRIPRPLLDAGHLGEACVQRAPELGSLAE